MKVLKNIFVLSIVSVLLGLPLNAVLQNEVSDYDQYRIIKYALQVENPGQNVIYSITQLGNPLDVYGIMELFFRQGDSVERKQVADYLSTRGTFQGRSIFHRAALLSDQVKACRIMRFLFQVQGSQCINQHDDFGYTPLHYAAQAGHEIIIRCLVENGADVTIPTHTGKLAFELAHDAGYKEIRDYLACLYQEAVIRNNFCCSSGNRSKSKNTSKAHNNYNIKNMTICYSNL